MAEELISEPFAAKPAVQPKRNDVLSQKMDEFQKQQESAAELSKLSPEQIEEMVSRVDVQKAADEILTWLVANVEQYVENKETSYLLFISVPPEMKDAMPNAFLIQDAFMRVPEETGHPLPESQDALTQFLSDEVPQEVIDRLYDMLSKKVDEIKAAIMGHKEGLQALFKRLVFFYEMTGFSPATGPVIQEMAGEVKVNDFYFDPIAMSVQVAQGVGRADEAVVVEEDDEKTVSESKIVETGEKRVVRETFVPAGFGIDMEISFWQGSSPSVSMY